MIKFNATIRDRLGKKLFQFENHTKLEMYSHLKNRAKLPEEIRPYFVETAEGLLGEEIRDCALLEDNSFVYVSVMAKEVGDGTI